MSADDLDYSFNAIQIFINQNNLAFFGSGVLTTTTYPAPFPIAINAMGGTVGKGIAYDPTGLQLRIDDLDGAFTVAAADPALARKDLLALRYKAKGTTQIPRPDSPTSTVFLNLVDGYELAVIAGAPAGSPAYPAKGQYDVILAGLGVAAGASAPTLDLSVREIATPLRAFFPQFEQETLSGEGTVYLLSKAPFNAASVLISVDGVALQSSDYSIADQTVTLHDAAEGGQSVEAFYVVNATGSVNPVAGMQETPLGSVDGANQTFQLTGNPVDQKSTRVYVNGLGVPVEGWSLLQSPQQSAIIFNAGYIPAAGSDVYAFYLQNVVPIGSAPAPQPQSGGSPGGGGASVNLATEYPQLSPADITNGYVTLARTPTDPASVLLDLVGGGAQAYQADFTVTGNRLTWSGDLQAALAATDRLRIQYAY